MFVCGQLLFSGKPVRQQPFQLIISLQHIKNTPIQYIQAGIGPCLIHRLIPLYLPDQTSTINIQCLITSGRPGHCHRGSLPLLSVICDYLVYINIKKTISSRNNKCIFINIFLYPGNTLSGRRIQPGIHHRHLPVLCTVFVDLYGIGLQIHRDIRLIDIIIHKVFFDHIHLITATDNEFIQSIGRKVLHNVPEHWLSADFRHGLRDSLLLITDGTSLSAGQDDYFHCIPPLIIFSCIMNSLYSSAKIAYHFNDFSTPSINMHILDSPS